MSHRWTAVAAFVAIIALEGQAEAIRTLKLPLMDGMTCNISVHTGFQMVIYLPEPANHVNAGDKTKYTINVENRGMRYLVQPKGWPPPTNINLRTASATLSLHFSMTDSSAEAITVIQFTPPDEWDNPKEVVRERCGKPTDQNYLDLALMTARREEVGFVPGFTERFVADGHDLTLTTGPLNHSLSRLSFRFTLHSDGTRDYPIQGLSIRDGETDYQYLRCWRLALIRDGETGRNTRATCGEALEQPVVLRPGERLEGELTAERPEQLDSAFVFQVHTRPGVVPAVFRWSDKPPKPERVPHNLHKLALSVQSVGGALQLNGVDGAKDWTDTVGLGVRATYTALPWLSVTGIVDALRSGDAMLDGTATSVAGGRFQAQLMAHFGERFVPYFRAGVGVFAGSMSSNAGSSEFRFGGIWGFGVGADAWIGERLVAGIGASYLDGELLSAELGVHVGYVWDP